MRGLSLSLGFTLLSAFAAKASALDDSEYALILSRQAPGTPQFECHSDCGNALAGGRIPNHCDNSTWVGYYEGCLDCALDFNIWRIYGNGVGAAAESCGLSASPSPSGDDGEAAPSSTSAAGDDDEAAPSSTSAAGDDDDDSSTSASGADETPAPTTTAEPSGSAIPSDPATTEAPTTESGETAEPTETPTTSVTTAAAPRISVHVLGNLFGAGAMAVVLAGLMGAW